MYTLFSNERLGMLVEEVRLHEIRSQIEAQRLAGEVKPKRPGHPLRLAVRWLGRAGAWLMVTRWLSQQSRDTVGVR
jgi:hypothetical protein